MYKKQPVKCFSSFHYFIYEKIVKMHSDLWKMYHSDVLNVLILKNISCFLKNNSMSMG